MKIHYYDNGYHLHFKTRLSTLTQFSHSEKKKIQKVVIGEISIKALRS